MTNEQFLKYVIPAQKKFKKMYNNEDAGVLNIDANYVQISEQRFKELVNEYKNYSHSKLGDNWYQVSIMINDIEFISVGTKQEFK